MKCQRNGCTGEIVDGVCEDCGRPPVGETVLPTVVVEQAAPAAVAAGEKVCPECLTPNDATARFCEICRHDFQNGTTGVGVQGAAAAGYIAPPAAPAQAVAAPVDTAPAAPIEVVPLVAAAPKLNVVISVDPSLADDDNRAQCPANVSDRIFPLDLDENLVGRRSDVKAVYPEIMLDDPGASRRHLKFIKAATGFTVLELGSANGTKLNGQQLQAGVPVPVNVGDELVLGMWTRLKLAAR